MKELEKKILRELGFIGWFELFSHDEKGIIIKHGRNGFSINEKLIVYKFSDVICYLLTKAENNTIDLCIDGLDIHFGNGMSFDDTGDDDSYYVPRGFNTIADGMVALERRIEHNKNANMLENIDDVPFDV